MVIEGIQGSDRVSLGRKEKKYSIPLGGALLSLSLAHLHGTDLLNASRRPRENRMRPTAEGPPVNPSARICMWMCETHLRRAAERSRPHTHTINTTLIWLTISRAYLWTVSTFFLLVYIYIYISIRLCIRLLYTGLLYRLSYVSRHRPNIRNVSGLKVEKVEECPASAVYSGEWACCFQQSPRCGCYIIIILPGKKRRIFFQWRSSADDAYSV